ncbi:uncharacterized protein LOC144019138 [Festucalex cinctus]
MLKELIRERLITAADEIYGLFARTVSSYEEQLRRARQEIDQLKAIYDKTGLRVEGVKQREDSSSLKQDDPQPSHSKEEVEHPQSPDIKEEEEEVDVNKFHLTGVFEERDGDQDKTPEWSQLHYYSPDGELYGGPSPQNVFAPLSDSDGDSADKLLTYFPNKSTHGNKETSQTHKKGFICSVCGKVLANNSVLIIHMRKHTGEKPFICLVCGKAFVQKSHLRSHMITHTGEKPFSCSVCDMRFSYKCNLNTHMRKHTTEEEKGGSYKRGEKSPELQNKLVRRIKKKQKKTFKMLKELVRERLIAAAEEIYVLFETTMASYEEQLCRARKENERQRRQLEAAKTVMHIQDGPQLTGCQVQQPFPQFGLSNVMRPSYVKEERRYVKDEEASISHLPLTIISVKSEDDKAPECNQSSGDEADDHAEEPLTTHSDREGDDDTHTGVSPFTCAVCGQIFSSQNGLDVHVRTHTLGKPFRCSVCGKTFAKKSNMVSHVRIHTGEKPFSCPACGKGFAQKISLVAHERTHTGEKPFVCAVCGKSFFHKPNMVAHRKTHTGEKPHGCSVCGATFFRKESLASHARTHTGEKPFACPLCGKAFSHKPNMVAHRKTHTGEKPFACAVCAKAFTHKANMVLHMRTHSGERPFACPLCEKRFTQKAHMESHLKTHAGGNAFTCSLCGESFVHRSNLSAHLRAHGGE